MRTLMILVVILAAVVAARLAYNHVQWGTWFRPSWVWEVRGRDEILAAYRNSPRRNLEVLSDLQSRLSGLDVTVFGSSVRRGVFVFDHWHSFYPAFMGGPDIDLMIEVDWATFAQWAETVYGPDAIGTGDEVQTACASGCCGVSYRGRRIALRSYEKHSPTRTPRREVAEALLGVDFGSHEVDVFLFPHEFVRGEAAIPEWDRPERSFRAEALAGTKLAELCPGRVTLREYFPKEEVIRF